MRCAGPRGRVTFAAAIVLLLAGCASSTRSVHTQGARGGGAVGVASYYAAKYQGRTTASGETFDNRKLTAAHRTLAFGTTVRVTNLTNGRSVTVRVNDRGPFAAGRIIDLSRAAAERLDMIEAGLARVKVETLAAPRQRVARGE
jgi:rare lipoprotein A